MTTERRRIDLPTPPTINHAYLDIVVPGGVGKRLGKKARVMRVPTDEMKRFKTNVGIILRVAGWTPMTGEMAWSMTWRRERRSGDLSNREKVLEDALKGLAWDDDAQVVEKHTYRVDDPSNPGVTIEVWPVGQAESRVVQEGLALTTPA